MVRASLLALSNQRRTAYFFLIACLLLIGSVIIEAGENGVQCLREVKAALGDPEGKLSSWSFDNATQESICGFAGISCSGDPMVIGGLHLSCMSLSGDVPPALQFCTNITFLDLSNNSLTGYIPSTLCNWLPKLTFLGLSNNSLSGPIPSELFSCHFLDTLHLGNNNFSGHVPSYLEKNWLTNYNITTLSLSNNSLTGHIPSTLCDWLPRLNFLDLSYNYLSGPIPFELFSCRFLDTLHLGNNFFSGRVPFNLEKNWPTNYNVTTLSLSKNSLTGYIPSTLCVWLPKLTFLDLSYNSLSGPIPFELFSCRFLNTLHLGNNNFSSHVPFNLEKNRLTDYNVMTLSLSKNSLTGHIPSTLCDWLPKLTFLDLSYNSLSGPIPFELFSCRFLDTLYLNNNNFSGHVPSNLEKNRLTNYNVTTLNLSKNSLTGYIPSTLCVWLPKLTFLDLSYNSLSGSIPFELFSCRFLDTLYLDNNNFSSYVPFNLEKNRLTKYNITTLSLSKNFLTGYIPSTLCDWLPKLTFLNLSYNSLSGPIPFELFSCRFLYTLFLSNNNFSDRVLSNLEKNSLPSYNVGILSLSNNSLTGYIPLNLCDLLLTLTFLDLSYNSFSGPIPADLSNCNCLTTLLLDSNLLSGFIPKTLGSLNLHSFSVANNKLSGPIPTILSYKYDASSFSGNPFLCGLPLSSRCQSQLTGSEVQLTGSEVHLTGFEVLVMLAAGVTGFVISLLHVYIMWECCCVSTAKPSSRGVRGARLARRVGRWA